MIKYETNVLEMFFEAFTINDHVIQIMIYELKLDILKHMIK